MSEETNKKIEMSDAGLAEKNCQKAPIRQNKLAAHPYARSEATTVVKIDKSTIKLGGSKLKDTGGGFFLEVNPDEEPAKLVAQAAPVLGADRPACEACAQPISTSYLFDTFGYPCCDECRDPEAHKLITKTEAAGTFLLKDCDFALRDPPLRFVTRKNPHNERWGDMKLYLRAQVEQRALEVWGSEERLDEEHERREERKVAAKGKKYQKRLHELKMSMRSSLYDRTSASHAHVFGPESYNEEDDTYARSCTTCSYEETFEKM